MRVLPRRMGLACLAARRPAFPDMGTSVFGRRDNKPCSRQGSAWVYSICYLIAKSMGSLFMQRKAVVLSLATSFAFACGAPSLAAPPLGTDLGTGKNLNAGERDATWKIVSYPGDFTPDTGDTKPYSAYVVDNGNSTTENGNIYREITTSIGSTGSSTGYNQWWIFARTFNVPVAGDYAFAFNAFADNGLKLFINGTPPFSTSTDSLLQTLPDFEEPTILGATQLGTEEVGMADTLIQGTVSLNAGDNTLYALLRDYGSPTRFRLASTNFIESSGTGVPAPLPIFGAAAAFSSSRRLKRRIRLARITLANTTD